MRLSIFGQTVNALLAAQPGLQTFNFLISKLGNYELRKQNAGTAGTGSGNKTTPEVSTRTRCGGNSEVR
jgi:hypothetical protein